MWFLPESKRNHTFLAQALTDSIIYSIAVASRIMQRMGEFYSLNLLRIQIPTYSKFKTAPNKLQERLNRSHVIIDIFYNSMIHT